MDSLSLSEILTFCAADAPAWREQHVKDALAELEGTLRWLCRTTRPNPREMLAELPLAKKYVNYFRAQFDYGFRCEYDAEDAIAACKHIRKRAAQACELEIRHLMSGEERVPF